MAAAAAWLTAEEELAEEDKAAAGEVEADGATAEEELATGDHVTGGQGPPRTDHRPAGTRHTWFPEWLPWFV